jgi:hypothetical protein
MLYNKILMIFLKDQLVLILLINDDVNTPLASGIIIQDGELVFSVAGNAIVELNANDKVSLYIQSVPIQTLQAPFPTSYNILSLNFSVFKIY